MSTPPLASGPEGTDALRPLLDTVLHALDAGRTARGGPLPAGGPPTVAARLRQATGDLLPEHGDPNALATVVRALAEGAADPAHPLCAAHLHCPPLAVATAADLAASTLNPSLDSWDQAPAASELEALVTRTLAAEIYGRAPDGSTPDSPRPSDPPDSRTPGRPTPGHLGEAVITTGGTEANQLALLLAREAHGATVRLVCGTNAHHSLTRAAWLLGLPEPIVVPAPTGRLDPTALATALPDGPTLVAATAGTTDAGLIDPLPEIAALCRDRGARLHIDAAYGGGLLFSDRHRTKLTGLDTAHTVTLDLHKLGWQPIAAGLLAVRDPHDLAALHHHADYLNADDDTDAGLPDLLGRSLRTTRRPDALKIAVTLKTLGRTGLAALIDQVCEKAQELAALITAHPHLRLHSPPTISTVLFRPTAATDDTVAEIRRHLLTDGHAVLGRARLDGRLWLKATLLNPHTRTADLTALLRLVEGHTPA
ncbi:pyridoxal phosphate-dependent decarboxylase family protein [Streptomyces sp. NPDC020951]|uniref:pyridoxal phosphate-dependent decarboxylase family protein n=1 Tax=Streptomyces sp. NPDC020951 TaxID=3365104 RepID=UPI00379009BA